MRRTLRVRASSGNVSVSADIRIDVRGLTRDEAQRVRDAVASGFDCALRGVPYSQFNPLNIKFKE